MLCSRSQEGKRQQCVIIEKYGPARVASQHIEGERNGKPSSGNPAEFAARLVQALGTPHAALRHLEDYIKTDGEERRNVRNVLIDMLESEAISKGGK